MKLKNLLYSSWFLYFIVFVVFFNIVGHALHGNYIIIVFFILISFITSFFSKNMIIILVLGIAVSNILFYGPNRMNVENFADKSNSKNELDIPSSFNVEDLDEKNDMDFTSYKLDKIEKKGEDNQEKLKNKMEEIKQVKERIETMKKDLPKNGDKTNLKEEELEFLNSKFKDFLKIQEDVLSNIGSLEKSIQNVDTIVKDIRNNVDKLPKK